MTAPSTRTRPAAWRDEAGDDAQQRGLAAAGRAEQGHELAGLDGQGDVVDGQRLAVADGQLFDVERARRGPGRGREGNSALWIDCTPPASSVRKEARPVPSLSSLG